MSRADKVLEESGVSESLSTDLDKAVKDLISKVKSGDDIDPRSMKDNTDGELLAMIMKPIIQGAAMHLKDAKGFRAAMKKAL